jgi:hypothetical protein
MHDVFVSRLFRDVSRKIDVQTIEEKRNEKKKIHRTTQQQHQQQQQQMLVFDRVTCVVSEDRTYSTDVHVDQVAYDFEKCHIVPWISLPFDALMMKPKE